MNECNRKYENCSSICWESSESAKEDKLMSVTTKPVVVFII